MMRYILTFVLACFYSVGSYASSSSSGESSFVVEKISLPVDYDGVASFLEAFPNESAEVAARKWVMDHGLGKKLDVDNILRELVYHLRTAGARSDAPGESVVAPYRGALIASLTVRAPLTNADGGELGPPHTLSVLQGETPRQAVDGFLSRMGLTADANRLEESLLASIESKNNGSGIKTDDDDDDDGDTDVDEFEAPLPAALGVSLNVTFERESGTRGRTKQTIHVRYGENAVAATELFLVGAGIVDPAIRAVARKSIVDKLLVNAEKSLQISSSEKSIRHDDDVIAREALIIPLAVGAVGDISSVSFDVAIEEGASLRGAARVFCSRQWEVLRLPLKLAAAKWTSSSSTMSQNESSITSESYNSEPTLDTCVSLVFNVFRDFYSR